MISAIVAAGLGNPTTAIAHDSNGPLSALTSEEPPDSSSSNHDVAAPGNTRHFSRLQIEAPPIWHPYRSHKHSQEVASLGLAKATSADTKPGPAAAVSIYEDQTLRRGDAVMTAAGLRIFEGSHSFPYQPADFSTLDASKRVPRSIRKDLALYDHQIPERPEVAFQAPDMVIHVPGLAQR